MVRCRCLQQPRHRPAAPRRDDADGPADLLPDQGRRRRSRRRRRAVQPGLRLRPRPELRRRDLLAARGAAARPRRRRRPLRARRGAGGRRQRGRSGARERAGPAALVRVRRARKRAAAEKLPVPRGLERLREDPALRESIAAGPRRSSTARSASSGTWRRSTSIAAGGCSSARRTARRWPSCAAPSTCRRTRPRRTC